MHILHLVGSDMVLFSFWRVDSFLTLLLSAIIIFILSCLNEFLKVIRNRVGSDAEYEIDSKKAIVNSRNGTGKVCYGSVDGVALIENGYIENGDHFVCNILDKIKTTFSKIRLVHTVLYMGQLCLWYVLMCVFMVGNVWLCLALLFGVGFGYFFICQSEHM